MTENQPQLNDGKTEAPMIIIIPSKVQQQSVSRPTVLSRSGKIKLKFAESVVRNLGVIFDSKVSAKIG